MAPSSLGNDDIDLGSIYGMHGLTRRSVASVADAFTARGFHVETATYGGESWLGIMKRHIKIDWFCYRVHKGHVAHFPNVSIPVGAVHPPRRDRLRRREVSRTESA